MAEPATQDASIALYRYMCQKIVGSEEHVKAKRKMNAVRDHLFSHDNLEVITSGSFGEGLEMRGSDIDIMYVFKFIEICENINVPFNPDKTYFTIETRETKPGFTQLRLKHTVNMKPLEFCEEIGGEYYLSNFLVKQHALNSVSKKSHIHGPCISDKKGILDIAICFHSKSWITQAQQWITRSNNSWPEYDVKQFIVPHGVLFVPKGVQGSTKEEYEWRISFSVGEKLLIYSFTHTQLLCYALMKILLKEVINTNLNCKELLCSYFLKTLLFWICEELPITMWIPANLISNFMRCVKRLIYCVKNSICPHYFIPENNLFEYKIIGHAQETLLTRLNILYEYGWHCIFFSDQISCLNELEFPIDDEASQFYFDRITPILTKSMHTTNSHIPSARCFWGKGVLKMFSIDNTEIKSTYLFYMSKMYHIRSQLLPLCGLYDNKSTYKQYKVHISSLLTSTRHDVVSGWLMLASFFYKTKQFKRAVVILNYSRKKCTSEKLHPVINLSHIPNDIFKNLNIFKLFRRMPIAQLTNVLLLNPIMFIKNSTVLPDELQIENYISPLFIPPVVYVHFLLFLCHYHLKNAIQCLNSLNHLRDTIEKDYFIPDAYLKTISNNIFGIAFQLLEDIHRQNLFT